MKMRGHTQPIPLTFGGRGTHDSKGAAKVKTHDAKIRDDVLSKRRVATFSGPEYVAEVQGSELRVYADDLTGRRDSGEAPADLQAINERNRQFYGTGSTTQTERRLVAAFHGDDFVAERLGGVLEIYMLGGEFADVVRTDLTHDARPRELAAMNRRNAEFWANR